MPNVRYQLSTESKVGSWIIDALTDCPYSHIDLICENGNLLGSRSGIYHPPGGVQERPPDYATFSKTLIVELPVDARLVEAIARQYIGKPYSYLADAAFLFHPLRRLIKSEQYNCSWFQAMVLEQAGFKLWDLPPEQLLPRDFAVHILSTRVAA